MCDSCLGIEKILRSFTQSDSSSGSGSSSDLADTSASSTPPCTTTESCLESVADELERKISSMVAVCVQGSAESLQTLLPLVTDTIHLALRQLSAHAEDKENQSDNTQSVSSAPITSVWGVAAVSALSKYLDPVILGEKIKSVAERISYGNRSKGALLFEDTEPLALWRWETLRYHMSPPITHNCTALTLTVLLYFTC